LVLTWPLNGIYYRSVEFVFEGLTPRLVVHGSAIYYAFMIHSMILPIAVDVLLIRNFMRRDSLFKRQSIMIIFAASAPVFGIISNLAVFGRYFDATPICLSISCLIFTYMHLKLGLHQLMPNAREQTDEKMRDGVIIVDRKGNYIDTNAPARRILPQHRMSSLGINVAGKEEMKEPCKKASKKLKNKRFTNKKNVFIIAILAIFLMGGALVAGYWYWYKNVAFVMKLSTAYDSIGVFNNGVAFVSKGDNRGMIDTSGQEVIPVVYSSLSFLDEDCNWIMAKRGAEYGVMDTEGNLVIPLEYELIFDCFILDSEDKLGLILAEKNGAQGCIDTTGQVVIPFEHEAMTGFTESGHVWARKGYFGCFDTAGNLVVQFEYDRVSIGESLPGQTWAKKNGQWMSLDASGNVVIQLESDYDDVGGFSGDRARVEKDGRYGFIDPSGREVIPVEYNDAKPYYFSNGYAVVRESWKWGYIDKEGNVIVPFEYDDTSYYHEERIALIQKGGKWGVLDIPSGTIVLPAEYDDIGVTTGNIKRIKKGDKFGAIDTSGNIVLPVEYDFIFSSSEGLAAVQKDGKWGYIDANGSFAVPLEYDSISYYFKEGLAAVQKDGKWGCVDTTGNVAIPPGLEYGCAVWEPGPGLLFFTDVGRFEFNNSLARVANQGKIGMINTQGKEVVPVKYDWINDFNEGYAAAHIDGEWYILSITSSSG
jgi:hypothetical protein